MAEMTSHSQECLQGCFTPRLSCAAQGCCRVGVTSSCSQPGLPAWHIGSGMLHNGASNDSCWSCKEAGNHSSNRQWRFLQLASQSTVAPSATANITHAQVSCSSWGWFAANPAALCQALLHAGGGTFSGQLLADCFCFLPSTQTAANMFEGEAAGNISSAATLVEINAIHAQSQ